MNVITCAYCGQQYPEGTPASGAEILTEHIKVCDKHPLRRAEEKIAILRSALEGLIGASTKEELKGMEAALRLMPAPAEDKAAAIDVIHALLCTMEDTDALSM